MAAKKRRGRRDARRGRKSPDPVPKAPSRIDRKALFVPAGLIAFLFALSATVRVVQSPRLLWSFWAAAAVLFVFLGAVMIRAGKLEEGRRFEVVLRPQHWIQAICQLAVFVYWGFYWRPVYDMAVLIAAQLAFAYAFDMLLAWWRSEKYVLGFGPFPIIFSINLFLWFRDDWFYLQFLMIAVGFLGKALVRWERDGRRVHIFNPSAFALGLFSLVLIATNTTDLTWGQDIASTLTLAPWIYSYLFLVGLIVMYFFSITLVAGFAAATLFAGSALYGWATGVPYFIDSEIPAAVFLGLHLLVTDPSTSPRSRLGKAMFGVLYGVGVFGLYTLLELAGTPTFYDKLLCVPLLNLSVRGIDGLVARIQESGALDRLQPDWSAQRLNLAHMAVWCAFFATMSLTGRTDARHVGDTLPFWQEACAEDRPKACDRLLSFEAGRCAINSAWACNEMGVHFREGTLVEADAEVATGYFERACELRFQPACLNILRPGATERADPKALDLRVLLSEGGPSLTEASEPELYLRACDHGWSFACDPAAS